MGDALFFADRFRRFVRAYAINETSEVVLGYPDYSLKMRGAGGIFPDAGAGICYPWRVLQRMAAYTKPRWMPVSESTTLPAGCANEMGILDDVVVGWCLRELGVQYHPALIDEKARPALPPSLMPRHLSPDELIEANRAWAENWTFAGRIHHLVRCMPDCEGVHPSYWVDEAALISAHGYKDPQQLRKA